MYQCICYSCEAEETRKTLERAQAFFNDHADRGHHPEFVKLDGDVPEVIPRTDDDRSE